MRRRGIRLLLGETTRAVEVEPGDRGPRARVELESGRCVRADRLLVAAGRAPSTAALDLERAGIALDAEGQIKVDSHFRTTAEGVYAAGDVIGFPALASTSMHQWRLAVLHAVGRPLPPAADLPLALYTIPEISAVGRTEQDCREQQIPYEVGFARYAETPRGQILGDVEGMLKLIFRRDDHRLIGVHLIGEDSSELVHTGLMCLYSGASIEQLASAVFNYPTLSEAYRVAALDGLNRL
jgi:NAD(P) transhydrogenase